MKPKTISLENIIVRIEQGEHDWQTILHLLNVLHKEQETSAKGAKGGN